MKTFKNLLTGALMFGIWMFAAPAPATSIREFQKMPADGQIKFLHQATEKLLAKVKAYDPVIEQKTSAYMYAETNAAGFTKGVSETVDLIRYAEKKRPETIDKVQVETIIKVVMRDCWKKQGLTVPKTIFEDPPKKGVESKP